MVFPESALLPPGRYNLSLALKDELSGHLGSREMGITVPFLSDILASSSLILADQILPSPPSQKWPGAFLIGANMVRPRVDNTFASTSNRHLGIYMQVYNLDIDDKIHKPSLNVRYTVEKDSQTLFDQVEAPSALAKASQQFIAIKLMRLEDYAPGKYTVRIKVSDNLRKQTISPSASFELR